MIGLVLPFSFLSFLFSVFFFFIEYSLIFVVISLELHILNWFVPYFVRVLGPL